MKKRTGFVSNSSSSSFILVGIKIDDKLSCEELAKTYITEEAIKEFIGDNKDKFYGENKDEDWWEDLWREKAWEGDFKNSNLTFVDDDLNINKRTYDGRTYCPECWKLGEFEADTPDEQLKNQIY